MLKTISNLMIILMFLTASCTTISCHDLSWSEKGTERNILPRSSFVKIKRVIKLKVCDPTDPEDCFNQTLMFSGSGFIVKNDADGSYIMTAGHVCDDSDVLQRFVGNGVTVAENLFIAIDIDEVHSRAKTIAFTMCEDICIAYAPGLFRPAIKLSTAEPTPGDEALNLAAPLGIFEANMIPILHGHFNGLGYGGKAIYSVPAKGGSSGSPILNHNGELIGMIHSAHVHFPFISLSPTHAEISEYILRYANRKALLETIIK